MPNKYLILGALVAAVGVAYMLKKGASAVADAANEINPFNNNNVINRGFTSVYQATTGSTGTLGTDLFDLTHDPEVNSPRMDAFSKTGLPGSGLFAWIEGITK